YGNPSFGEDPRLEDFIIDVSDHVARVGRGIDVPDFDDRLRYVGLETADIQSWLMSEHIEPPQFLRDKVEDSATRVTPPATNEVEAPCAAFAAFCRRTPIADSRRCMRVETLSKRRA